jgi:hypothetical protein
LSVVKKPQFGEATFAAFAVFTGAKDPNAAGTFKKSESMGPELVGLSRVAYMRLSIASIVFFV